METPLPFGAAVLLVDSIGRVLLQQRDDDVPPAGYGRWTVPGGHSEPGETPLQTALREFLEETGVALSNITPFHIFPWQGGSGPRGDLHVFYADDEVDEAAIEVNEGLAFTFWSPEQTRVLPMNPPSRTVLESFFADVRYGELAAPRARVSVIALNRWGQVLMQRSEGGRRVDEWALPGGRIARAESPDAAALRLFDGVTGALLESLRLFRSYPRTGRGPEHVYYDDPDLILAEGDPFVHFAPADLPRLHMAAHTRTILNEFLVSPAYRALFH